PEPSWVLRDLGGDTLTCSVPARRGRLARRELRLLRAAHPHLAEALDRGTGLEVLELEHRPHFDLAFLAVDRRVGEATGPVERLLARFHVDDRVAGDQLLGFSERAVDDLRLRA